MLMLMLMLMLMASPISSLNTISLDSGNVAYRQAASQSHTLRHYEPGKGWYHVSLTCHVSRPGCGR